jgi:hypothetical protein
MLDQARHYSVEALIHVAVILPDKSVLGVPSVFNYIIVHPT